jgi:Xaa-Pro aminopeptidase
MLVLDRAIRSTGTAAYVAYGSSRNPDVRYLTRFRTDDPVIFIKRPEEQGRIVVGQMEVARAIRESAATPISRAESGLLDMMKEEPDPVKAIARTIAHLAGGDVLVPPSLPYQVGHELEALGRVVIDANSVRSMRSVKDNGELTQIRAVQNAAEVAMDCAVTMIRDAVTVKDVLFHQDAPLTSERVRAAMHKSLADAGCHALDTIVSCGKDTAIPHVVGSGPLLTNEPIVIDIFPQHDYSGYYSDMTRTVARGEPDGDIVEMYQAVREAQDRGQSLLRAGVTGQEVHQAVVDLLSEMGFESGNRGFIHNLGHGVGLEVHEQPSLGPGGGKLAAGNVVTVEPGLYYEGTGGIRLENIYAITECGSVCYTRFPREFIL